MVERGLGEQLKRLLRSNHSAPVVQFVDRRGHDQSISSAGLLRRAAGLETMIASDSEARHRPITITEVQGAEALVAVVTCICASRVFHVRPLASVRTTHDGIVLTGPSVARPHRRFPHEISLASVADDDPSIFDEPTPASPESRADDEFNATAEVILRMHIDASSTVASFVGIDHELGLLASTLAPLLAGSRLIRADESFFLRNPQRWMRLLNEHDVTHAIFPLSALNRLVTEADIQPGPVSLTHVITDGTDGDDGDDGDDGQTQYLRQRAIRITDERPIGIVRLTGR